MASVRDDGNGRRSLQFKHPATGKRQTLRLGKATAKQADSIRAKVEALLAAKLAGLPLDGETATWLGQCGDELLAKLATAGLCAGRRSALLAPFLNEYIDARPVKEQTRRHLRTARDLLVSHFGAGKPLRDIEPGDADAWRDAIASHYAPSSLGRHVKRAREFFRAAARRRLVAESPFQDVATAGNPDAGRRSYVTLAQTAAVLAEIADPEFRLAFVLARVAGLRTPSEQLSLRWAAVDWERGRFQVVAPKTEHQEGGGRRWVPLLPELRAELAAAFDRAADGAEFVFVQRRESNLNQIWRKALHRAIVRAGLTPWAKAFNNLRASAEIDLAQRFPLHVVAEWLGHSPNVARKNYLRVTDGDFERASNPDAKSDARATQSDAKADAISSGVETSGGTGLSKTVVN